MSRALPPFVGRVDLDLCGLLPQYPPRQTSIAGSTVSNFHRCFDLRQAFIAGSTSVKLSSPLRPPSSSDSTFDKPPSPIRPRSNFYHRFDLRQSSTSDSTSVKRSPSSFHRRFSVEASNSVKFPPPIEPPSNFQPIRHRSSLHRRLDLHQAFIAASTSVKLSSPI